MYLLLFFFPIEINAKDFKKALGKKFASNVSAGTENDYNIQGDLVHDIAQYLMGEYKVCSLHDFSLQGCEPILLSLSWPMQIPKKQIFLVGKQGKVIPYP